MPQVDGDNSIVLHVLVVGFHHKKGYQIEYCHPPLPGASQNSSSGVPDELPYQWETLPSLTLPDGAHNVNSDIIYFTLPSLENPNHAIFGISCYRQIAADNDIREKDSQITRSSIQKSVCVLSTLPLFGVLKAKLEVITQAYFNEKDFSKVEVLKQLYANLLELFNTDYLDAQTIYSGISLKPLLETFRHKILILFKLLLLERKVVFYAFPVQLLGDIMMGLISLFPMMLEEGLSESAFYSILRRPHTSLLSNPTSINPDDVHLSIQEPAVPSKYSLWEEIEHEARMLAEMRRKNKDNEINERFHRSSSCDSNLSSNQHQNSASNSLKTSFETPVVDAPTEKHNLPNGTRKHVSSPSIPSVASIVTTTSSATNPSNQPANPSSFRCDGYGFPLSIFSKGSIFHPYLSIMALDMLCSDNIRAFCIGVTNQLFTMRQQMLNTDVLVKINEKGEGQIEIFPADLRKLLTLTKQDTKFINAVLEGFDQKTDSSGWEGSDDWVRTHMNVYLLSLLTAASSGAPELGVDFNVDFINAWRELHNYRVWSSGSHPLFEADNERDAYKRHPVNELNSIKHGHYLHGLHGARRKVNAVTNGASAIKSRLRSWLRGSGSQTTVFQNNLESENSASTGSLKPTEGFVSRTIGGTGSAPPSARGSASENPACGGPPFSPKRVGSSKFYESQKISENENLSKSHSQNCIDKNTALRL